MNERRSSKRFDLEPLENRVLLSADPSLAAFNLPAAPLVPSEVFEETLEDVSQASDATIAYDPGVAMEEIFAQAQAGPEADVAGGDSETVATADAADEAVSSESPVLPSPIEVAVAPQSPVAGMAEQLTETLTGANGPPLTDAVLPAQELSADLSTALASSFASEIGDDVFLQPAGGGNPAHRFNIQFRYDYPTADPFFTDKHKRVLEAAASYWATQIGDDFPSLPLGTMLKIADPSGITTPYLPDFASAVAIDDILIFVGSRALGGNAGAEAGFAEPVGADQTTRFNQPDFQPWAGSITFNRSLTYYIDETPYDLTDDATKLPGKHDFLTIAIHEIGHILGFDNRAAAFRNLHQPPSAFPGPPDPNATFNGPLALAANGSQPVPLLVGTHIKGDNTGLVQGSQNVRSVMVSTFAAGTRLLPQPLDLAILGDIGYQPGPPAGSSVTEVWAPGGVFNWNINDVDAGEGQNPGWDLLRVNGDLKIADTSLNPFKVKIISRTLANAPGNVHDFDPSKTYTWRLVTTSHGIKNFSRAVVVLDGSGFTNTLGSGVLVLDVANGNYDLVLRYLPTLPAVSINQPTWTELGPNVIQDTDGADIGAIHSIALHPANPKIAFVGTVAGGVWRTDDITVVAPHWVPLTDSLPTLFIGAVAVSPFDNTGAAVTASTPADSLVVYLGTGAFSNSALRGPGVGVAGVFKSTDGGRTWSTTGTSSFSANLNSYRVTSIVPSRTDASRVFVGTVDANKRGGGLYSTTDGGATWQLVSGQSGGLAKGSVTEIVADPANATRFYVAVSGAYDTNGNGSYDDDKANPGNGIYRTDNNGLTWTKRSDPIRLAEDFNQEDDDKDGANDPLDGHEGVKRSLRIRLAVSAAAGNPVYAAFIDRDGMFSAIFRSADLGVTWVPLGAAPPSNSGEQGLQNFSIVADPTNPNVVYIGGDRIPNIFRGDFATPGLVEFSITSSDPSFAILRLPPVPVNVLSDGPGVIVVESNGSTAVVEGGAGDSIQVRLRSAPTMDVRVRYETQFDGLVGLSTDPTPKKEIIFTPANWNVLQTINVSAPDDMMAGQLRREAELISFVDSADPEYDFLGPRVSVTVTEKDPPAPGIIIVQSDGVTFVVEGVAQDTYTVVLNSAPQFDIKVTFDGGTQLKAVDTLLPANAFLTFTPVNWNMPQTVRVTALTDGMSEPSPHLSDITHAVVPSNPAEPNYKNLSNLPKATARIVDQGAPGVTILPTGDGNEVTEGFGQDTFFMVLNRAPSSTVRINLIVNAQVVAVDNANPANNFLTFTAANWFVPQRVRVTAVQDGPEQDTWFKLQHERAGDTSPHSDSRNMIFAGNDILEVDDGGIARLVTPNNAATRRWVSLNGDLRTTEVGSSVAYDSRSKTIVAATQDNGNIEQTAMNSLIWRWGSGGDGNQVAVDVSGRSSISYQLGNNFSSFERRVFGPTGEVLRRGYHTISKVEARAGGTHDGKVLITSSNHGLKDGDRVSVREVKGVTGIDPYELYRIVKVDSDKFILKDVVFAGKYESGGEWENEDVYAIGSVQLRAPGGTQDLDGLDAVTTFSKDDQTDRNMGITFEIIPMVLNAVAPEKLLLGRVGLYESQGKSRGDIIVKIIDDPMAATKVSALAYGGRKGGVNQAEIIYVARGGTVSVRTPGGSWNRVKVDGAGTITDFALDPENWEVAFAVDGSHVYMTQDGGMKWSDIGLGLESLSGGFRSVELIARDGRYSVLVGATDGVYVTHIYNAPTFDPQVFLSWVRLGSNLPNVLVTDIDYDRIDNVLVIGTLGRGVWIMRDAGAHVMQEPVLRIETGAGAQQITLRLQANTKVGPKILEVLINGSVHTSVPLNTVRSIEIHAGSGDDRLTVDATNGEVVTVEGISFDGDEGADHIDFAGPSASKLKGMMLEEVELLFVGSQTVLTRSVESANDLTTMQAPVKTIRDAFDNVGDWFRQLGSQKFLGMEMPIFGGSLGAAFNGDISATSQPATDLRFTPGAQRKALASDTIFAAQTSLFTRLLETGLGGFEIDDLGRSIATESALRDVLAALDPNGTVMLTMVGGVTRYQVQVQKTISANAALDIELLNGQLRLHGFLDISADVTLRLTFGVDADGFFIETNASAEPEIKISNIRVTGRVDGVGQVGFLGVQLSDATVTMDSDVAVAINLTEPGPDRFTGMTDGRIRLYELTNNLTGALTVTVTGDPTADDVMMAGTFILSAVTAGGLPLFNLGSAQLTLTWPDINDINRIRLEAPGGGVGGIIVKFLNFDAQEVLGSVKRLLDWLGQFREAEFFALEIPYTSGTTLGEVFDFSQAFLDRIYGRLIRTDLVGSTGGNSPSPLLLQGRLSDDSTFTLQVGRLEPVTISVARLDTAYNKNLGDLVDDLNQALRVAGIDQLVSAILDAGRISFRLGRSAGAGLILKAEAADPIIRDVGFISGQVGVETSRFGTLQGLFAELQALLDPDAGGPLSFDLIPGYNRATNEITFQIAFEYAFTKSIAFQADTDIDLGSLLELEASGTLSLEAKLKLGLTLGFDLKAGKVPELSTSPFIPPPSSGRLTQDARFAISLNDGTLVNLVLLKTATDSNSTLDQLVADLNTLFAGTTVSGGNLLQQIYARKTNGGITIAAVHEPDANQNGSLDGNEDVNGNGTRELQLGVINAISIVAAENDPIYTEIGFLPGITARSGIAGFFVENVSARGTLTITASDLAASARFGIFALKTSGGIATGTASVALALKNPADNSYRLDLGNLFSNLGSIGDVLGLESHIDASLKIELNNLEIEPGLIPIPAGSKLGVFIPDIHDLTLRSEPYNGSNTGIFLTYPDLGSLFNFSKFGFADLIAALDVLVDLLKDLRGFSFLSAELPLINASVSDLVDYAADLARLVQELQSNPSATLVGFEERLEAFFGLDPSLISLLLDEVADPVAVGNMATFTPTGLHNDLAFVSTVAATPLSAVTIRLRDNDTFAAGQDTATASYDSASKTLTIVFNASYTTADTVVSVVNALHTAGNSPVMVSLSPTDAGNDGSGAITKTALRLSLNYSLGFGDMLPLQFDLASLVGMIDPSSPAAQFLSGVTSFLQVSGSASLDVNASVALRLDLGIDLTNPCKPLPFLYDTTGITFEASVLGTNLEFEVGVGALGVFVKNGTVTLDADGDPATTGPGQGASFRVGLIDNNHDGRHYFRATESFFNAQNINIQVTAGASAVLPIFFPIESIPLGSTSDTNGDGFPDNQLVVVIPDVTRLFGSARTDAVGTVFEAVYTMPGANNDLRFRSPVDNVRIQFLESATGVGAMVVGDTLQIRIDSGITLASQVAGLALPAGYSVALHASSETGGTNNGSGRVVTPVTIVTPDLGSLIGSLNLCDLVTHSGLLLDGLDALLGTIQGGLSAVAFSHQLPLVGNKLGKAANFIGDFREGLLADIRNRLAQAGDPITLVKQAIFSVLGPPGLNLLIKPDGSALTAPADIQIDCTGDQIDFRLRLRKVIEVVDTTADPIQFDIGIPGLGLAVDGNVRIMVGFDLKLNFGISSAEGFFLDTSAKRSDAAGPELTIDFDVSIPNLTATGELFFLQLKVSDEADGLSATGSPRAPSLFSGEFSVDLQDPSGSGNRLTFADMTASGVDFEDIVDAQLVAMADVNLDIEASFGSDARFPRFVAEFDLNWNFTSGGPAAGVLTMGFNNVRLDIGSFLSNFIQPVLNQIREITKPLEPVVDILTVPLPVLSDLADEDVTLLDLAEAFGAIKPGTRQFIEAVAGIIGLVNDTSVGGQSVLVNLGSLALRQNSQGKIERDPGMGNPAPVDLAAATSDAQAKSFLTTLKDLGFAFPFLQASELFKIFRGEVVTLVQYRMPVLELHFSYSQTFPIYPPLFAHVGGSISAKLQLAFGYDTQGLIEFAASADKNPADIFNGFFIQDLNDNGQDINELTLSGALVAGASINFAAAKFGVQGGLFADVTFNLNDPDADGKVRWREIVSNARTDLRCIFDIEGSIVAGLEAFIKIDLFFFSLSKTWRIAETTLLEFDLVCPIPVLASRDDTSGILTLHMGPRAGDRVHIDTTDNAESFTVATVGGVAGDESVRVSWNGYSQDFHHVTKLYAEGGNFNDTIDLRTVLSPAEINGDAGNDHLLGGEGINVLRGGSGNDTLTGGLSADEIDGGDGNDVVGGLAGADSLDGGGGTDLVEGGDDADRLQGGSGADRIFGGAGNDVIFGEAGNDLLEGDDGDDQLFGGADNDLLRGGLANDWMVGGLGNDTLHGGAGMDVLVGDEGTVISPLVVQGIAGAGRDVLAGGPDSDRLFGAGGNDSLFGGTLLENGMTQLVGVDGVDFIDGGEGNDVIFADDAHGDLSVTFPAATISGMAWLDRDPPGIGVPNGIFDADEAGMIGVEVSLRDAVNGAVVATTVTDAIGDYHFTGLAPGQYFAEFQAPTGLVFTVANQGTDDTRDSDASPVNGRTATVTVTFGQTIDTLDAGFVGTTSVLTITNVLVREGQDGVTLAVFTVSLSSPSALLVTVCYETQPDPAAGLSTGAMVDIDYEYRSWTLVFEPGMTSLDVIVPIIGDHTYEPDETFVVKLFDPYNAVTDDDEGRGTIINDDNIPVFSVDDGVVPIVINDGLVQDNELFAEQNGVMQFAIRLSNPSYRNLSVDWKTADIMAADWTLLPDSAKAGLDYGTANGSVTFLAGETFKLVSIIVVNDALNEADERFQFRLNSNASTPENAATLGDRIGEGVILGSHTNENGALRHDDPLPVAFFQLPGSATVVEGHAGLRQVTLAIQLSVPSGREVSVRFATARGTATDIGTELEHPDFVYDSARVVFAPGTTLQNVVVEVRGDIDFEPNEYFFVNLLNGRNVEVGANATQLNHAVVHITTDDAAPNVDHGPWSIQFSSATYSAREIDGSVTITLLRTQGSSEPAAVYFDVLSGTATAGVDYLAVSLPRQVVYFEANETVKTFIVALVDDALAEPTETLILALRNPSGNSVRGNIDRTTVSIVDDEPLPSIAIDDRTVTEIDGVGRVINFTVRLSHASEGAIRIGYSTADVTAVSLGDYTHVSAPLYFLPGQLTQSISIAITGDLLSEVPETFVVFLSDPINAVIVDHEGIGTIVDNDRMLIGGVVFDDANGNGFFDNAEQGLVGVSIDVMDSSGSLTPAITMAKGLFTAFVIPGEVRIAVNESTLAPGSVLTTGNNPLVFIASPSSSGAGFIGYQPEMIVSIPPASTGNGSGFNNDTAYGGFGNDILNGGGGDDFLVGGHWLGPGGGAPYNVQLLDDNGRLLVDPASLPPGGSIAGRVWVDTDRNGLRALTAEPGLANIQVNLFDQDYNLIATALTASNGTYRFENLTSPMDPRNYSVQFIVPSEYNLTGQNIGANDLIDSDASPVTGLTALIALNAGAAINSVDAGFVTQPTPSPGPWSIQFGQLVFSVRETDPLAFIAVMRTPGSFDPSGFFWTQGGTAQHGLDYVGQYEAGANLPRLPIYFFAEQVRRQFTIPIIDDTLTEGFQTVILRLSNPSGGAVLGNRDTALLLIFDAPAPDDDLVIGADGADLILGDNGYFAGGNLILLGGIGNDILLGGDGDDFLLGQAGDDLLEGAAGDDYLAGGSENDSYRFNADGALGTDALEELPAGGNDTVDFSSTAAKGVVIDLSRATPQMVTSTLTLTLPANTIENALGGDGDDSLTGDSSNNVLDGGPGNDRLVGAAGDDRLIGGLGDDTYLFDADTPLGSDELVERAAEGTDTLDFSATTTVSVAVDLSTINLQVVNANHSLTLSHGEALENLIGGTRNDRLVGNGLDNVIQGHLGNDILQGAAGVDTLREERAGNFALTNTTLTVNGTETDTYSGFENIRLVGDDNANQLDASTFGGTVYLDGRGGNDTLRGGAGLNFLMGGPGNDSIDGHLGIDRITEERNANFRLTDQTLTIGSEVDSLIGIEEAWLTGGAGNNTLDASGFSGTVHLDGRAGNDSLFGTFRNDVLIGGPGNDDLRGGAGDDLYEFDADAQLGTDTVVEASGGGIDLLDFLPTSDFAIVLDLKVMTQVVNQNLTLLLSDGNVVENVTGGAQADRLSGNDLDNVLRGGAGSDVFTGGLGEDTIFGEDGIDRIVETRDADFNLTNSKLLINEEANLFQQIEEFFLTGGPSANLLNASLFSLGPVVLDGAGGNDHLRGGVGNDQLAGGAGNDLLEGGSGSDSYIFDADSPLGTDTVTELGVAGIDVLDFSATTTSGLLVDLAATATQFANAFLQLVLTSGGTIENIVGGAGNDLLYGNNLNNTLEGGDGHDILEGRGGNDLLLGGRGDDTYRFDVDSNLRSDRILEFLDPADGRDTLDFSATTTSGIVVDLSIAGFQQISPFLSLALTICHGVENVIGSALDDTITGNSGDNKLNGSLGNDTLTGRRGNDTYQFDVNWGVDSVTDVANQGTDVLDFSGVSSAVRFDVINSLLVRMGTNRVNHFDNSIEGLVGGTTGDTFNIVPSALFPLALDGRNGTDVLNFNASGLSVMQTPTSLTALGRQIVTFTNIEQVNVTNAAPAPALAEAPDGAPSGTSQAAVATVAAGTASLTYTAPPNWNSLFHRAVTHRSLRPWGEILSGLQQGLFAADDEGSGLWKKRHLFGTHATRLSMPAAKRFFTV